MANGHRREPYERPSMNLSNHYHRERDHQGLGNRLIIEDESGAGSGGPIQCRERLGRNAELLLSPGSLREEQASSDGVIIIRCVGPLPSAVRGPFLGWMSLGYFSRIPSNSGRLYQMVLNRKLSAVSTTSALRISWPMLRTIPLYPGYPPCQAHLPALARFPR
jgi:hypothetical protein